MGTKIEWTDATWNPVVGCERCSPGCDNCYAIRVAGREMQPAHVGLTHRPDTRPVRVENREARHQRDWTGELRLLAERLGEPLRWRKPRRCFVCSMSDLFHPDVPDAFVRDVFAVMGAASQHTFQILTKRPQRMSALVGGDWLRWRIGGSAWPLPNVWLGTSVENQRYADLRIPHLLATPAAVRFLSIEPLLGPVDLRRWLRPREVAREALGIVNDDVLRTQLERAGFEPQRYRVEIDWAPIDWVIVGGESGPGARPCHPDWVRSIRDQCVAAGVPFFWKQWGEWRPLDLDDAADWKRRGCYIELDGTVIAWPGAWNIRTAWPMVRVGKKAAGRELDGRTWDEYPIPAGETAAIERTLR